MKKISLSQKQFDRLINIYVKGGSIIVTGILVTFSLYVDKLYQCLLLISAFFSSQIWYSYQYHATRMKYCLLTSVGVFSVLIYLTKDLSESYFISILFGLLVSYISCKIGRIQNKLNNYNKLYDKYVELGLYDSSNFSVKTCTQEQLIRRCRELNMSQRNIEFCIDVFINNIGIKDYINLDKNKYLNLNEQQERNRKTRMKKLLENK